MAKCSVCGAPLDASGTCSYCGHVEATVAQAQTAAQVQPNIVINNTNSNIQGSVVYVDDISPKSKTVDLLLCLFLGIFGAHKFYEGKIVRGVIYLCFSVTGLSAIAMVIDLVLIILNKATDSVGDRIVR